MTYISLNSMHVVVLKRLVNQLAVTGCLTVSHAILHSLQHICIYLLVVSSHYTPTVCQPPPIGLYLFSHVKFPTISKVDTMCCDYFGDIQMMELRHINVK